MAALGQHKSACRNLPIVNGVDNSICLREEHGTKGVGTHMCPDHTHITGTLAPKCLSLKKKQPSEGLNSNWGIRQS